MRTIAAQVPQNRLVVRAARGLTSGRLRVLGMHGVPDLGALESLVDVVLEDYHPVGEAEVAHSIVTRSPLPPHAVWFTFDDGMHSTFEAGELLASKGVPATAFVCPSVIGEGGWLWFQAVQAALDHGLVSAADLPGGGLTALKSRPDAERRSTTEGLEARLEHAGIEPPPTVKPDDLTRWLSLGHTVGNHTWDHPCLDTCSADAQRDQIVRAHSTLVGWGVEPTFFAYPNGNWASSSEEVLAELGYTGALLFDHRLTASRDRPLGLSRLRIDSDCDQRRALSILSGAHSAAFGVMAR